MKCKRIVSIITAALCLLTMSGAFAYKVGEARVAIGANLDSEQIAAVYSDFGIERGVIPEITVTNENERQYLEGLVDDKKIGHKAISCVYITILDDGSGLNVSTKNINWCTEQMYKNALTTAGITDADVKVTAPFEVSGTAALTGIYKAYEDITGNSLSSLAKMVGAEELIVTGQLAEYIGSDEATALINELKGILDITETMSDADVKKEIKKLAREIAARNIIAAGPAGKVAERKSVMVNVTRLVLQRRANVKENVVTIAVPRRVKQTSAARIRKSKEILS